MIAESATPHKRPPGQKRPAGPPRRAGQARRRRDFRNRSNSWDTWLNIGAGFWLAIGICAALISMLFLLFAIMDPSSKSMLEFLIISFAATISIVYIIAAFGVMRRKKWGMIMGYIMAILWLGNIPIGTFMGIMMLIGFSHCGRKFT